MGKTRQEMKNGKLKIADVLTAILNNSDNSAGCSYNYTLHAFSLCTNTLARKQKKQQTFNNNHG